MFTVEQIMSAHSKVKSGADFPAYVQEIKKLGVRYYQTFVSDGHTTYHGTDNYQVTSPGKYDTLDIAAQYDQTQFELGLKAHQQGLTDYPAFITACATFGVEKWEVNIDKMTCTYFDREGRNVLTEVVPQG
ncbi:DUF1398 domain-containing protein [Chitinophaga horti]|uniref:DUF1398 domain-containing protein n=1 Tax=Chitinophaga horti TaxID=2920382 RepID=A0ABY6J7N1_9BACT|nr:DUF1398 domain-containing protein [Chitinophaga horti]UYQ95689.1 DUF1398 domain-containing protein [Chitinophaga horti]